ncbi:MAG: hypothetical protein ACREO0_05470, partial [Pseudoxanthomonas sp.]
MPYPRIGLRILTSALLLGISGAFGHSHKVAPGPVVIQPKPEPKKKSKPIPLRQTWHDRWLGWLRGWAPAGGGKRECARRRRQIERGILNRSNGLQYSEKTQAEIDAA